MVNVDRQDRSQKNAAKKYGIATTDELKIRPLRYRWDLIERDVEILLARRRDVVIGAKNTFPEPLVNYMAGIYLSCCHIERKPPSENLLHLICQQLAVKKFSTKGARDKSVPLIAARELRNKNPNISNIKIAKSVGVDTATVGRWVRDRLLQPKE